MRKAIITLATVTRTLAMAARKIDPVYPGTAVARLEAVHQRLAAIPQSELTGLGRTRVAPCCGRAACAICRTRGRVKGTLVTRLTTTTTVI